MHVIICASPDKVGLHAAAKIATICRGAGPEPILGVATGSPHEGAFGPVRGSVP